MSLTKIVFVLFICLTFLLCYEGIYGDYISIELVKTKSRCFGGLVANVDNYTLNARIYAPVKTLEIRNAIVVGIYLKGATFRRTLCDISFSVNCENVDQSEGCYCIGYRFYLGHKTGAFEFWIKDKALLVQSQAAINIMWMNAFDKPKDYSSNVTLPAIFPQEQASLFVGKKEVDVKNCTVYFDTDDVVEWCVYNLLGQTVFISFDYGVFLSKTNCVRQTFRLNQAKSNTFTLIFKEHYGCERQKGYTCHWKATAIMKKSTNGCTGFVSMSCGLIVLRIVCFQSMIWSLFSSSLMI